MKKMQTQRQHIHFVGIGGCGMSGLADVLFSRGYNISGSDVKANKTTDYLQKKGIKVFIGHAAANINGAEVVVISSAISELNPEIAEAKQRNIPIKPRAQMLADIMDAYRGIAIAGTHGKTTTTSLMTSIFVEAKMHPTYFIGGTLHQSGVNAEWGSGEYCIVEADESDASFLFLNPEIAIVTNIDADHLWSYNSDFESLKQTFIDFIHRLPAHGLAVICHDDEINRGILPQLQRNHITYGFDAGADVQIVNYCQTETQASFQVQFNREDTTLDIILNLPGRHNALNAAATIIAARHAGVDSVPLKKALMNFSGVGRRFQIRGNYSVNSINALVVDDYGHHPREIAATLDAARAAWPDRRIVLAFQPHRYTRTKNLFADFVDVLAKPDQLILLDIYAAGELPIPGADGLSLKDAIHAKAGSHVVFLAREAALQDILPTILKENDILILQGAGDIGAMAVALVP